MSGRQAKTCRVCGRRMEWRRKWADCWDEVHICSKACRKQGVGKLDLALEHAILGILKSRTGSMCPSEAARRVYPTGWRDEMERCRRAARRLVARGEIVITQRGRVVDPSTAKGPIRLERSCS